ncbi:hypothetical protein [uncultured Ruminococcus sp.]|uniref:hypothetical protein n=1 Tax=uncultured Ruminococcus sp. TaxID=165186 RepID=UPI0025E2EA16|nr:hypothetical protein [uncultured Ruminococcus sp.]
MKLRIKDIAFESFSNGNAKLITPEYTNLYKNAVEAWNIFVQTALRPYEQQLRDELEGNGFNRWTGERKLYPTESELKAYDEAARRKEPYDI